MTSDPAFEDVLTGMRARLHRYCARMTGSAVDGEDVVQEVLIKAMCAHAGETEIHNVEGWLFRIAHNASLDFLRARARSNIVPLADDLEVASLEPDPDVASASFRTFLELPVLQRCVVILKDVLGHSLEEAAHVAGSSMPAAKAALQRGRQRLRELAADGGEGARLPLLSDHERQRMRGYVSAFRSGDFDVIREMLAEDVRLDLVNRLAYAGRKQVSPYFTRYAQATQWRFALGAVDGRAAVLVYDANGPMQRPNHFIALEWRGRAISSIKDFLYAPYAMEGCDWVLLEAQPA